MEDTSRDDQLLMSILQRQGNIIVFLQIIFGFLYRRTDFFRIQHSNAQQVGFAPGMAERILKTVFFQYRNKALQDEKLSEERKMPKGRIETSGSDVLHESQHVEITTEREVSSDGMGKETKDTDTMQKHESCYVQAPENQLGLMTQDDFQNVPESYNGAIRDNYMWSQTVSDLDVRVKVHPNVMKSSMVKVDLGHEKMQVAIQEGDRWNTVLNGDLLHRINLEESMWTLIPGECVHINLEKTEERWWSSILVGEPTINIQLIDTAKPLQEFDDESRAKIEEWMYQQNTKPDTPMATQLKTVEILKEAWDKEGSPFKGQPFDPSVVANCVVGQTCHMNSEGIAD